MSGERCSTSEPAKSQDLIHLGWAVLGVVNHPNLPPEAIEMPANEGDTLVVTCNGSVRLGIEVAGPFTRGAIDSDQVRGVWLIRDDSFDALDAAGARRALWGDLSKTPGLTDEARQDLRGLLFRAPGRLALERVWGAMIDLSAGMTRVRGQRCLVHYDSLERGRGWGSRWDRKPVFRFCTPPEDAGIPVLAAHEVAALRTDIENRRKDLDGLTWADADSVKYLQPLFTSVIME